MDVNTRTQIRNAVKLAVAYWPNAHLGEHSAREDIRRAFIILRSQCERGDGLLAGIAKVERSAYLHADI